MKAVAVIPARLASTRLPRKALRLLAGRPMIAWVYEAARNSGLLADVIVATDSEEIMSECHRLGFSAHLTSTHHPSGTDRVHEVAQQVAAAVYLNLQGDEPLVRPEHIASLLELMRDPAVEVGTLKTRCPADEISNPNAVKVVTNAAGSALYFSRAAIPFDREGGAAPIFKHLGFYGYRKLALGRFVTLPPSPLEKTERLEQLRFLENGIPIRVAETPFDTIGVDTEEDLVRAERALQQISPRLKP